MGKSVSEIPLKMWVAAFLISLPSFLFGYISAALNSCLITGDSDSPSKCYENNDDSNPNCPPGTVYNDIRLSTVDASLATSFLVIGAWLGCLLGSVPSEKYGRRTTMLWNNLAFIGGAIMCCISNKYILFAGRFVAGFGVGLESVVVPVLLSEIATADTRGTITTLHQLQITFGIFIAGIVGYGFVENVGHGWVYVQAGILIPVVIMFLGMAFIPESPKWLVAQGRPEDAKSSLYILRSPGFDVNAEVSLMIAETNAHVDKEEATWGEVFACRTPMIIGCGLMFSSAMSGINTVIFYSSTIFGFAGFDEAILATAAVGAVNFVATGVAAYLVDVMGRKQLLLRGTNLMTCALLVLSITLLAANNSQTLQGYIAVFAVLFFVIGFAIGLGAVSWVVMSEIMSTRLRTKAFGLFVSINWGFNLVIGLTTLPAIDFLGGTKSDMDDDETSDARKEGVAYLYIILACVCFCATLFMIFFVPETKGKSPEDFMTDYKGEKVRKHESDMVRPLTSDMDDPGRI
jgi:sugar porter (SP) family MFS transporter